MENNVIEILNENLLHALYQGYTLSKKTGFYISYEGFMPIISSMIDQYIKFLRQKSKSYPEDEVMSLNYLLTSTCWENTYSHQNPSFASSMLFKNDDFYNIYYPKDGKSTIDCLESCSKSRNRINLVTTSKRHIKKYSRTDLKNYDIMEECENPNVVLCATGDYMLDQIYKLYNELSVEIEKVKVVYITKPQILDVNSKDGLSYDEFTKIFGEKTPVIYLFSGYANTIKSLLYERNVCFDVLGYNDEISIVGNSNSIMSLNNMEIENLKQLTYKRMN